MVIQSWKNTSIKFKMFSAGLFLVLVYGIMIFTYLIPKQRKGYIEFKKEKIREMAQAAVSIIKKFDEDSDKGLLSKEEAQEKAKRMIKRAQWGPEGKDYFWINDFHPRMVMHPYRPDLDGKDISNFEDPNKKKLFVEMVKVCKKDGAGFVDYMWQWKDDKTRIVPKISYVKAYEPWGWIIGTGIYIEDVSDQISDIGTNAMFVFGGALIFTFLIVIITSRLITHPLVEMQSGFDQIAEGDLTTNIDVQNKDEFGKLVEDFNKLIQRIRSLLAVVNNNAQELANFSQTLFTASDELSSSSQTQAASAEEVTATTEEIAAGMDSIASGASEQSGSVDSLIQKMDELSRIIGDMGGHVQTTSDQSAIIMEEARSGEKILASLNTIMERISNSSREMTQIVEVITGISDQINLLSLNAAIEAARAGESGRGFAVVADEISKLADQTASSIKNIDQIIQRNHGEIGNGLNTVADTVARFKKIIQEVNEVASMMDKIADFMHNQKTTYAQVQEISEKTKVKSEEIRAATEEHKLGVNEIAKSISNINESVQANAMNSNDIASNSKKIRDMAETLQEKVDFFKV